MVKKKTKSFNSVLPIVFFGFIFFYLLFVMSLNSFSAETAALKGRVTDIKGDPVEGAELFVYNSPQIRRPADFISPKTDKEGRFRVDLPAGKYWVVARVRSSAEYGPLMPGDKDSSEPKEIELLPDAEIDMKFIVADLKEVVSARSKTKENYVKTEGRVLDANGAPVGMAYVFANKSREVSGMPDYLSAWTGNDGHYTLYLPVGKYFVGVAAEFPPAQKSFIFKELIIDKDNTDLDIISAQGKSGQDSK